MDSRPAWFAELVRQGRLTKKGHEVARFVEANIGVASASSAVEVACAVGVDPATVVRFAQALGFDGWREFRLHVRHRFLGNIVPSDVVETDDPMLRVSPVQRSLRRDLENLRTTLSTLGDEDVRAAAETLAASRKVLVLGAGSHFGIAHIFCHLAQVLGYPFEVENRSVLHYTPVLSQMDASDSLVAVTFWRTTNDIASAVRYCRSRHVPVIILTDSRLSKLSQDAEHVLVAPTDSGSFFQSLTAPLAATYALIHALQSLSLERAGNSLERAERVWEELAVFDDS